MVNRRDAMRKHEMTMDYHDYFEYFGNTEIERIRQRAGQDLEAGLDHL
jgi:hypothetical protein